MFLFCFQYSTGSPPIGAAKLWTETAVEVSAQNTGKVFDANFCTVFDLEEEGPGRRKSDE